MAYHKGAYSHLCYLGSTHKIYQSVMTEKIKVARTQPPSQGPVPNKGHDTISTQPDLRISYDKLMKLNYGYDAISPLSSLKFRPKKQ